MRLIDSHCHVNADRFDADLDLVLGGARLAGVERILVPGWDRESSERALDVTDRYPWLDAAVGIHPHDAATASAMDWTWIAGAALDPRVAAVGETGLDFDRVFSPIPDQLTNLRRNLELALATGKPAILHCRSAIGRRDAQDALAEELDRAEVGRGDWTSVFAGRPAAIIHSFSGPVDYAQAMIDRGLAISFSGLVFRRGEESSAEVARMVPTDRVLIETDSPFLSAPGAPRRRNEPEWVPLIAAWLAEQRETTPEALGPTLVANYDRAFRSQDSEARPGAS